jgi:tetratricopeptide (TPR) repeat protein
MDPELFVQARVLVGMGRLDEARPVLAEILRRQPDHHGALLLEGSLLTEDRKFPEALQVYERAARLWPRSAEARNALARCLHALGQDREALEHAEAARSLLPEGDNFSQTAAVYLTLVWCHRELREFREALAAAEEGLTTTPDAVLAHWASQVEQEMMEAEKDEC